MKNYVYWVIAIEYYPDLSCHPNNSLRIIVAIFTPIKGTENVEIEK